ncbi:phosphoglucomutase/phosphomannomutase family protein [Synechococcus sp. PCC 7336]|uniref:phosphoglucomutase/phosphomannomutase family protein n=1 Tax=Synechococcus sp. PCC 7336 TaxID=195250 RepID=UPI00034CB158|nr:phosphoglucomutase/phosphomannomutase family protein [Synechococcus sp. PCC 7336]
MTTTAIQFGTDGWRGAIAGDFTFANVRRATRAIACYLDTTYERTRPVLVGYDTRFLADRFARQAAEVLAAEGWKVLVTERDCPTPALAFAARLRRSAGALMFTASHNPSTDCGLKYIPDYAGPATADITDAISSYLERVPDGLPDLKGVEVGQFDPRPTYLDCLYSSIDLDRIRAANFSVVYDALYSTSRGYLDEALRYCLCDVSALHTYRDVLFGGSLPEPRAPQLGEMLAAILQAGAAVGMATDGDADRFGIADERGQMLSPNTVLMVLTRHLAVHRGWKGAVVRTVGTTHLLDRLAAQYGLEVYETPVGFKHIGQKMRELPVLIGGEESGGVSILGHIPEKDGILANLLVLEAMAYEQKPLSQIAAEAIAAAGGPTYTHRIDLRLTPEHKQAAMEQLTVSPPENVAGLDVVNVGSKDGVKLQLGSNAWVLVRPSGTEPLLRISMEADSRDQQEAIARAMRAAIEILKP